MLIEEKSLTHWIDHFYGYGSWQAKFWFIDYEEGGGEVPEEVVDKFNYFKKVQTQPNGTLCDLRELYQHVAVSWDGPKASSFSNLFEYRFGKNATLHGVWKNLIAFVHGYNGEQLPDLLSYQKKSFASPSIPNEALIHLYPLPSPHNHAWYYSWLGFQQSNFLRNRKLYEEHVYPTRIHCILSNIGIFKPRVVLMYGMNNINTLKKSMQEFYPDLKFNLIKASKQQTPQYHRVDLNGTTMLITTQIPTLRHNRIETGFDWALFGTLIRSVERPTLEQSRTD